ncbi:TonB-dependent receptor [Microbulbifer yueqingensis]|uniref:Outer membrane receptor proteins, mostly Fe transport n=1 Tax=Microbulbifer yueqingensis TaxID=658219 RepID=A0A1G8ZXU5_9GAMM|nr:TonB-dependent receptor [Microbulbifer yueqingensis]SDK19165.1 Outer membrane receptor proteins, mostly Fe transport [Microbulbifer yueqingensis]
MRRAAVATALLLSGGAFAHDQGREEADSQLETVVVTGSPLHDRRSDYSGSLAVLGGDALGLVNHSHIQQSLARVPGANLSRGNGQEYLPALRSPVLTGAGACGSVLTMQDGIPLFPAGFCNVNELFAAHSEQAGRIEVIRGPAGTLHGAGAMHGVVNVLGPSYRPGDSGIASLEAGPNDRWKFKSRVPIGTGNGSGLLSAISLASDGGYRASSGYDQQKLTLVHRSDQSSSETRFNVTNLEQDTAGYVVGEDAYRDDALRRSNPNPEAFRKVRTARLSHRVESEWGAGYKLEITPYARYGKMDFRQHFLPGQPLEETAHRSAGMRTSLSAPVTESLHMAAGLDWEYTRASLRQSQSGIAAGSEFLAETVPPGRHYDYRVDALLLSPYTLASLRLTERLVLEAGLRLENLSYGYDNRMLAGRTREDGSDCGFGGCRYSRPADRSDDFENWSPHVGLVYDWTPARQLFVNLAHGFRAPQATELYRLQRDQEVADLDSEEIRSAEVGMRGWAGRLDYEVVGFAMKKRNVIFRDADFFNRSGGTTTHRGLELALGYQLAPQWSLDVSASYAEHRYNDERLIEGTPLDGKLVDSAPWTFGSTRLQWQPDPATQLELEWLHQGRYHTDPLNRHGYPGHDLLHVRASRRLGERWSAGLRLLNLLDEQYAERADFSNFSGDRYFPGESRALYASLSLQL